MASREEFRDHMKAAAGQIEGPKGPCPHEAALIAYHGGAGDEPAREAIASHLTLCAACREVLLDVRFWTSPDSEPLSGNDLDREWRKFVSANMPGSPGSGWPRWFQWPALAWAPIFAVVVIAVVLGLRMRQRVRAELTSSQERIQTLEAENRSLRAANSQASAQDLPTMSRPRLDATIADVYPRDVVERSAGARTNLVRISAAAPAILILHTAGAGRRQYAVEIADSLSRQVWRGMGAPSQPDGSVVLSITAGFLTPGEYTVTLAPDSGRPPAATSYLITVTQP